MQLEGKIIGPWVGELRKAWEAVRGSIGSRKLSISLSGLSFVDAEGMDMLREIYAATGASFLANSPLTRHFAEMATGEFSQNGK